MIDGIRRRFRRPADQDTWDADLELSPEVEGSNELPTDTAVLLAATYAKGEYTPNNSSTPDYCKVLIQAAIQNGGRHGDHAIPVPWLRMILAGLESKRIEPEMMWYGFEAGDGGGQPQPDLPSYEDLFPR